MCLLKMLITALLVAIAVAGIDATCIDYATDCKFEYGAWSACDPCKHVQSRHVNVTTPPHHNGIACPTITDEQQSCTPTVDYDKG